MSFDTEMFASIWTGKEFELRETHVYHPDSTIVRMLGGGLCGTDRHLMGLPEFNERSFGHEMFAEVVRVGNRLNSVGGDTISVGDKVIVTPGVPCMECAICTTYAGHEHMCNHRKSHGFAKYNPRDYFPIGGFANYIELVDDLWVVKVDDDITFAEAMFAEPVAIAVKAVERGIGSAKQEFEFGAGVAMRVAVIGLGPIGCASLFVLKSVGAEILGLDVNAWKSAEVASIFSVDTLTVPADASMAHELIRARDPGEFDLVIDCSGSPRGFELAIKLAKKGGRIVEVGAFAPGTRSRVNPSDICKKELEIFGSALSPVFTYSKVMRMLRKFRNFDLNRLTTHHITLDSMSDIFDIVEQGRFIKVHVDPMLSKKGH